MDFYALLSFIWLISSIIFWIMAFNKLRVQKGGLLYFLGHFIGVIVVLFIFSASMIASTQGCTGMFCGLGELLITLGVIILVVFFYPLLLNLLAKNRAQRFPSKQQTALGQEDILDDLI